MKRLAICLLVLTAAPWCIAQEQNLLLNGSFEEISITSKADIGLAGPKTEDKDKYPKGRKPLDFGKPIGWDFQCWGLKAGEVALDTDVAAEGKQSLKVTLPTGKHEVTVRQQVRGVEAGATYALSFKVRRSVDAGRLRVRLYPYPVKRPTDKTFRKLAEADEKGFSTCAMDYEVPEGGKNLLVIMSLSGAGEEELVWWLDEVTLVKK